MTPLLSFVAQHDQVCRQYSHQIAAQQSINIACRSPGKDWQPISSIHQESDEQYVNSSQNDASKAMIDQMIVGEIYGAEQETQAIAKRG